MEYDKKVETTHFLTLDDKDMLVLRTMLKQWKENVADRLPTGASAAQTDMLRQLGVIQWPSTSF
jgi:hypothetical protein